ncbi:MAG TPA: DUF5682 family protein [Verrucomicrobiae bacterium]
MVAGLTAEPVAALLPGLITERVTYFPIRHHSPACAHHLERLIRERRPDAILVEGPASFTPLIPLILHPKTKAPFAVYTSFVEEPEETPGTSPLARLTGPPRHAAYYPFCDYSPELVALRTGAQTGASLRFIDLDYPGQVRAEKSTAEKQGAPRVESLQEERHFKRSRYLQALARRAGCRDHNDLWDHLFETRMEGELDLDKFIHDVAAWCYYARADASPPELEADGTTAREAAMAAAIQEELEQGHRVLVVTGGFHTVALPALVETTRTQKTPPPKFPESVVCLIRYSFEQLDALNGYAAGMPAPYYYDQIWQAATRAKSKGAYTDVAARFLVELGQLTRQKKLAIALSPADEIAALEQSSRLAALRAHPGPTREDLLDGIRSCFVKGAMDAEGAVVLGLARHALGGTRIGEVPAEAGSPPIVGDFHATALKLRLNIRETVRRKTSLDLYRKVSHRQTSRFLHSLAFLNVPFGTLTAGPDFVNGSGLERLFEHWNYQWSPQTESHLIEAGIFGATVEEAATNRLALAIAELEKNGQGRCAAEAVKMLIHACRMGLHRHTERLLGLVRTQIDGDPALGSLVGALNQLILLWESREPLEAHRLTEVPSLIQTAYQRACYLLHNLAVTPAEAAEETLSQVLALRDLLHSRVAEHLGLDAGLCYAPLRKTFLQPTCPPLLSGGMAGVLHGEGHLPEDGLMRLLAGSLNAASSQPGEQTAFLTGLLRACRELAWRQRELIVAVEKLLSAWSEEEFVQRIPHLRMAFAELTPAETDRVAGVVAEVTGGERIDTRHTSNETEADLLMAVRVNALVQKTLADDGLSGWLAETPEVPS